MVVVNSYPVAVLLCVMTMLCWGSWANTQKLATKEWQFQLFYCDYSIGVLVFALLLAFTVGSSGDAGRAFLADLGQADRKWLASAFLGGVIFNGSNILLVAAIDVAGLAVAFPIGVGLALVLGVITTYLATRSGNVPMLTAGVAFIGLAIILDALAYKRLSGASRSTSTRGIMLAVIAGVLMGGFYSFVAQSMGAVNTVTLALEPLKLSPYSALVVFSLGLFLSSFLWNGIAMAHPVSGPAVAYRDYFTQGNGRLHMLGILGGVIWNAGMAFSILAGNSAGPALSYGLGQGATMVGAIWGVFIWKEFDGAPQGTGRLLAAMFACYLIGLSILIGSRLS